MKINSEDFKKEMEQLYPLYDFSKCVYVKSRENVIVIVPEYGEVLVKPYILRKGQWKPYKWTTLKFITEAKKKFPNKEFDYSKVDYVNNDTKIIIGCPICGDFEIRPGDFLRLSGCPKCHPKSLKEELIVKWFEDNNIKYIRNYAITLSNNRKAFIDFYVNGIFIEYNGIQHYKDVKFFKNGHNIIPFSLENQQERDKLVSDYCKLNNIPIIWLNYTQSDRDIIEILKEII